MKFFFILFLISISFCFADYETNLPINKQTKSIVENLQTSSNLASNQSELHVPDEKNTKIEFSFFSLYSSAHIVVKIVMYILLFFSLVTWSVFFYKIVHFKILFSKVHKSKPNLKDIKRLEDLHLEKNTITSFFIDEINDEIQKSFINDSDLKQRLNYRLSLQVNKLQAKAQSAISPLATIGSSAPFIGLFGTVWGIMNSFISIANAKSVSLGVVAPGIAEALFATALGLAAAIPAVIIYNFFVKLSNKYVLNISEISSDLMVIADREISYIRENK